MNKARQVDEEYHVKEKVTEGAKAAVGKAKEVSMWVIQGIGR